MISIELLEVLKKAFGNFDMRKASMDFDCENDER